MLEIKYCIFFLIHIYAFLPFYTASCNFLASCPCQFGISLSLEKLSANCILFFKSLVKTVRRGWWLGDTSICSFCPEQFSPTLCFLSVRQLSIHDNDFSQLHGNSSWRLYKCILKMNITYLLATFHLCYYLYMNNSMWLAKHDFPI